MRVTIRVRPGAGRTQVGGAYDGALVVRVGARAVDGHATEAALAAVAAAFGLRRRDVALVSGTTSRTKIVDVVGGDLSTLQRLLGVAGTIGTGTIGTGTIGTGTIGTGTIGTDATGTDATGRPVSPP